MVKYTEDQIHDLITQRFVNQSVYILAPIVRGRKGHYRELFEQTRLKGYLYARVDGKIVELKPGLKLDRYSIHNIEIVIDKIVVKEEDQRLKRSIKTALEQGKGTMMIFLPETENIEHFSKNLMCPDTGISYDMPQPHTFSFNSPAGWCPVCKGLGEISEIDISKIISNTNLYS